ncbi:MAG: hypothetical protein HC919_12540 [Oscillatoriales cyanobacterium SM2_2_1]|nr:hypothetical protein [Oscillatoriales cyanobacterium SM2_2_1]
MTEKNGIMGILIGLGRSSRLYRYIRVGSDIEGKGGAAPPSQGFHPYTPS